MTQTIQKLAIQIAAACETAYSFDRWSSKGFEGVAVILLTRGFTSEQTIAVLCSKEMRWAADVCALSTEEYNYIPAARFTEYEDKSRGGRGRARPMTAREATTLMFPDQPKLAA